MARDELLVIDKTYELVRWYLGHLAKFPRSHRYGLGLRIEDRLYSIMERLIRAKYAANPEKEKELAAANLELEVLRMFSRLADEAAMLPHRSYEHAARQINEVGRMVGGWQKQQKARAGCSPS